MSHVSIPVTFILDFDTNRFRIALKKKFAVVIQSVNLTVLLGRILD